MGEEREISTPAEFLELKRECIAQVKFYVDLANNKLGLHMEYPRVEFSLRGTTAGRAWYGKNLIQFSPILLLENPDTFIRQTAGHEVGHLMAHARHRGQQIDPHGREWRNVMWTMGLPATRCHNYDTSNVPTKTTTIRRTSGALPFSNGRTTDFD